MKRIILAMTLVLACAVNSQAVLKEENLGKTLSVLRAELQNSYKAQKKFMQMYEQRSESQHKQLIEYIMRSEQIGLMLYSQKQEFTLDQAYACQQATDLWREMNKTSRPRANIQDIVTREVARYDSLIATLEALPPAVGAQQSLSKQLEAVAVISDSTNYIKNDTVSLADRIKANLYTLSKEEQKERDECIIYAKALRNNLVRLMNTISKDIEHRKKTTEKVNHLYNYAQERYKDLRDNIFVNAGTDYFTILSRFALYISQTRRDVTEKYMPLNSRPFFSEWRGPIILGVSIFILFYIFIATILSLLIIKWIPWIIGKLWPRFARWTNKQLEQTSFDEKEFKQKRNTLVVALGLVIFIIAVIIVKNKLKMNLVIMAAEMMIDMAWIMEAVVLSLLIRLNGTQIGKAVKIYLPFISMAFIVILFRIILIPNNVINLIYPPILLGFIVWQAIAIKKNKEFIPISDCIYAFISLFTLIVGGLCSWFGYGLLAIEIMIWWMFQLTAILSITCMYTLMTLYEKKRLSKRVKEYMELEHIDSATILKRIKQGDFISQTWFFDLISKTVVPILAVISILGSVMWAAGVFDMNEICRDIFLYNIIDEPDIVQISLFKLCIVVELFFIFRYLNYAIRSFYHLLYKKTQKEEDGFNETLTRNIVALLVWGIYIITAMVILHVPKSGISVVAAGLATGMGFAMKDLLENFFYGISLMTGRVRVGDYIECEDVIGKVESITYQSTQIVTLDGSIMAFLNAALFSKNFKNLTKNHNYMLCKIPVGVAYGTDINVVRQKLTNAIQPLTNETFCEESLLNPEKPVEVMFKDFGDNSVDLNIVVWLLVARKAVVISRIQEIIYNTLNEIGVEIPYPQRDIHIR